MKYSTSKYVQVLHDALEGKEKKETDLIISNFINLLASNKHLKYVTKIIVEFNKLYNKKNGIIEAEAISSNSLDKNTVLTIKEFYKQQDGVSEVEFTNTLNKEMMGGVILRTDDEIIDGSVEKKLIDIRKQLLTT